MKRLNECQNFTAKEKALLSRCRDAIKRREYKMPERSKDWMNQAIKDLKTAEQLIKNESFEWSCFIALSVPCHCHYEIRKEVL